MQQKSGVTGSGGAGVGAGGAPLDAAVGVPTVDGGTTWAQLAATATSEFYFVNNIAVVPSAPSHLYAATNTGLWKSVDGGNTWSLSLASPDGGPAGPR